MSKITFRADDDLVERVEALDTSKSEVMREALRAYLDRESSVGDLDLVDRLVSDRVERALDDRLQRGRDGDREREVNVNITVERDDVRAVESGNRVRERSPSGVSSAEPGVANGPGEGDDGSCARCGEALSGGHVYCPNCGEKATRRLFCECGDELRSDWAYCPGCGRRTPSAEVLDG